MTESIALKKEEAEKNKESAIDSEKIKEELRDDLDGGSESSESEPEDEYGKLLTNDVEEGLSKVLKAIKSGDKALFDPKVKFFKEPSKDVEDKKSDDDEHKPIYLKDYHRMALLETEANEDEEDEELINGNKQEELEGEGDEIIKPYTEQQEADKAALLSEINKEFEDKNEDGDDETFLKKKQTKVDIADKETQEQDLPDPAVDGGEKFLEAYMDKQAWIPTDKSKDLTKGMNEDDPEFDDAAERFENAYNFRFEDPHAAEIVSYARSQATMRREKMNSRKKDRKKEQDKRRKEKQDVQRQLKQKKQKKINMVMDRIKEVREAVGKEVPESVIASVFGDILMQEDFDSDEWDQKMNEVFEKYYGGEEEGGKIEKPQWSDDEEETEEKEGTDGSGENEENEDEETVVSKRKQKRVEKHAKRQQKEQLKQVAVDVVEKRASDILDEVQQERGRSKVKEPVKFRYREVSPESFGLTTRDILFASDTDLNEFVGLKKLAPYRRKNDVEEDKMKFGKKKRLSEWRKKVFHNPEGPDFENKDDLSDVKIPSIVNGGKHRHRHKHKHGNKKRRAEDAQKSDGKKRKTN